MRHHVIQHPMNSPTMTRNIGSELRSALNELDEHRKGPPAIVFVTGASGAGKTFLIDSAEQTFSHPRLQYIRFDRIGVPSQDQMIMEYGSGENWQRATTREWIRRFLKEYPDKQLFIFEGQYNLDFARAACNEFGITKYRMVVVTVPDEVMSHRLTKLRGQPELLTRDMVNWSRFLKEQGQSVGALLLDTSAVSTEKGVSSILTEARKLVRDAV